MTTGDFGAAVRRWRQRATPDAAGLPVGPHRRATGLRREELALLAGISVDYVTRLEQGRATNPSDQVVEALGSALKLTSAERTHLFTLAGLVAPGRGTMPREVGPGVRRILDRLADTPVAVFDAAGTELRATALYRALVGEHHGDARNAVWRAFLGPAGRIRHTPAELHDLRAAHVSNLRAAAHRYPDDADVMRLIHRLRTASGEFAELWESAVPTGLPTAARKTIDHPDVGVLTLDCDVLSAVGSDHLILLYTAEPGTADADRLARLTRLIGPVPASAHATAPR